MEFKFLTLEKKILEIPPQILLNLRLTRLFFVVIHLYSVKHLTYILPFSSFSLPQCVPCIIFRKRANQCRLNNCTLRATYEENAIPYKYFGCTLFWFCMFSFYYKRRQRCCRAATLKCTRLNCVCGVKLP